MLWDLCGIYVGFVFFVGFVLVLVVSFFCFFKDKRKRRVWINVVNRDKWMLNEYFWICFDYFVEGWYGDDLGDENYVLILFFYKKKWIEDDFDRE